MANNLHRFLQRGFNWSHKDETTGKIVVACSECHASIHMGVPLHDRGCPNAKHQCGDCHTEYVSLHQSLCERCQGKRRG